MSAKWLPSEAQTNKTLLRNAKGDRPRGPRPLPPLFWLFILLLAGCGQTPHLTPLVSGDKILAFGDSLTYGSGADFSSSYPAELEKMTGFRVVNVGIPGETSGEGLNRLSRELEEHKPDLVLLCEGGNDFLGGMNPRHARENLSKMIKEIRDFGADVILIGVPQMRLTLADHPMYSSLAAEYRVPYLKNIFSEILSHPDLKSDSIHPNAAGYQKLAEAVRDLLKESGALSK